MVKTSYDEYAKEFAETRKHMVWEEVKRYLDELKGNVILDIGCGYARYSKIHGGKYIGMDNSKELIRLSLRDFPHAHYVVGDIRKMPFKDKAIKYSMCIAVIHHLRTREDRIKAIKEVRRVSRICLFSVWYYHQKRFKGKGKDINIGWRGKHERFYHIYDFEDIKYEFSQIYGFYFAFLDYRKRNIYVWAKHK